MTATHAPAPFSVQLREQTSGDHRSAEQAPFLGALIGGELPLDAYVDMLAQHRHAYAALEAAPTDLLEHPEVAPFVDPGLARLEPLDRDLHDLAGADWPAAFPASPATERYVTRLVEVRDWPGGFVAHHYTRYLGDLSGGRFIGRRAAATYDLTPDRGGRFARFDELGDVEAFKARYRRSLDAAPWDAGEQARVIAEIREAYRLNTDVFVDLSRHVSPA